MTATMELPGLWDHAPWRPLPALWDGRPVEWEPWELYRTTRSFHTRPECCERCGSIDPQPMATGRIDSLLGRLTAFRCLRCGQDTVIDRDGQMWLLDESDYGPEGSTP